MKDEDFKECRYINEIMRFINLGEFIEYCDVIRILYKNLSNNGKMFYKWYIYANIHMNEQQKNACWDYLNEYSNKAEFFSRLRNIGYKYQKNKCILKES